MSSPTLRIPNILRTPLVAICSHCGTTQGVASGELWPAYCECGGKLVERNEPDETLFEIGSRVEKAVCRGN